MNDPKLLDEINYITCSVFTFKDLEQALRQIETVRLEIERRKRIMYEETNNGLLEDDIAEALHRKL